MTYAKVGIDINRIKSFHEIIKKLTESTLHNTEECKPILGCGHYAAVIDIGCDKLIALHVDGVGTKVLISQMMDKYDTVGFDLVAMHVNDLVCIGAKPIALVDYIAVEKFDKRMLIDIMDGLCKAAREAKIMIVGGETAVMPDVIKGVDGKGYDLSGMSIGLLDKDRIITGEKITPGDVIIGLESNGIHSNGLTLARKVLLEKAGFKVDDIVPGLGHSIGEELLRPTRIYSNAVLDILNKVPVKGLAHITGGAFTKLRRLNDKVGFKLDKMPKPPTIFKLIQEHGNVDTNEMYRTFNMGIGFCIIADPSYSHEIINICAMNGIRASIIGKITSEKGVVSVRNEEMKSSVTL